MNRYVINVAVDGRHYCKIQIPETIPDQALHKATEIKHIFWATLKGELSITMTRWNEVGHNVAI